MLNRPFERHIDSKELRALTPTSDRTPEPYGLSSEWVREARRHVESCSECRLKVATYCALDDKFSGLVVSRAMPDEGDGCPKDVDWPQVAAGLWPELETRQLMLHAALCEHCGPLLRTATTVDEPTAWVERLWAKFKARLRPPVQGPLLLRWKVWVPAVAVLLVATAVTVPPLFSGKPLSGPEFAAAAVRTHEQRMQGGIPLEIRSDSALAVNSWSAGKGIRLHLPVLGSIPGEDQPFRLEGARVVKIGGFAKIGGKAAAFLAYRMQTGPVSLMVTPDTVAMASGGVEVKFKKVTFHYGMVDGYKVVTWSVHGLTYALVSEEGNSTQRSCMVCHAAMKDRDLSQTPSPLSLTGTEGFLQ